METCGDQTSANGWKTLDTDRTLTNNIGSSDITSLVLILLKSSKIIPVKKIQNILLAVKICSSLFSLKQKIKVLSEMHNLDKKKAYQENDTPVKTITNNIDIFY